MKQELDTKQSSAADAQVVTVLKQSSYEQAKRKLPRNPLASPEATTNTADPWVFAHVIRTRGQTL